MPLRRRRRAACAAGRRGHVHVEWSALHGQRAAQGRIGERSPDHAPHLGGGARHGEFALLLRDLLQGRPPRGQRRGDPHRGERRLEKMRGALIGQGCVDPRCGDSRPQGPLRRLARRRVRRGPRRKLANGQLPLGSRRALLRELGRALAAPRGLPDRAGRLDPVVARTIAGGGVAAGRGGQRCQGPHAPDGGHPDAQTQRRATLADSGTHRGVPGAVHAPRAQVHSVLFGADVGARRLAGRRARRDDRA
mmetsp:Transcript_90400/g.276851  ORF Transcript_90400/g.276851 Transcript_90400/m.276851 type:complete len:249 (+) Transcript_90400:755-1501(+)